MASARKKQDEKNLKILRELVSLPGNKHCFDCNQRGPTYVNMTIGSFVCTKCSGMLRGLTPPHRVKSISMASFTAEEVDLVKSRGNDYCRQTWLALYDQNTSATETKDDQQIKDFMMDKYERKRYYHDKGLRNGTLTMSSVTTQPPIQTTPTVPTSAAVIPPPQHRILTNNMPETKPLASLLGNPSSNIQIKTAQHFANGTINGQHATVNGCADFVADFGSADIFSATQFNNNSPAVTTAQPSFANFDNNVIFNSATYPTSYDLLVSQLSQMPRFVANRWNVTSSPLLNHQSSTLSSSPMTKVTAPPSEDRYAALKDLDNALKSQQQQQQETHLEWNTPSSNGSGYASPSQSGSLYGSPSTAGSLFGSPSQGHFATAFPQHDMSNNMSHNMANNMSNPFSSNNVTRNPWAPNGNGTVVANNYQAYSNAGANPFRTDNFNGTSVKYNGTTNGYNGNQQTAQPISVQPFQQQSMFSTSQSFNKPWTSPNPFMMGVTPGATGNSNNPFL